MHRTLAFFHSVFRKCLSSQWMVDLCLLETRNYPMGKTVNRPFVSVTPTATMGICASLLMDRRSWTTGKVCIHSAPWHCVWHWKNDIALIICTRMTLATSSAWLHHGIMCNIYMHGCTYMYFLSLWYQGSMRRKQNSAWTAGLRQQGMYYSSVVWTAMKLT